GEAGPCSAATPRPADEMRRARAGHARSARCAAAGEGRAARPRKIPAAAGWPRAQHRTRERPPAHLDSGRSTSAGRAAEVVRRDDGVAWPFRVSAAGAARTPLRESERHSTRLGLEPTLGLEWWRTRPRLWCQLNPARIRDVRS